MAFNTEERHSLRSLSPMSSHNAASHGTSQPDSAHHNQGYVVAPMIDQKGHPIHREASGSPHARSYRHSWRLEILAWLLGFVSLTILIVVLGVFNGKPLSRWHSSVHVNTLVNVLTTIASTALIFPVASAIAQLGWLYLSEQRRPLSDLETFAAGPMSACNMLWKHPSRPLVYLGTLNVVLLLLFSPITQETVDLPIRQESASINSGSIPTTLAYQAANPAFRDVLANSDDTTDGTTSINYQSVDRSMGAAIVSGIFGTPASPSNVTADCQTGNCASDIGNDYEYPDLNTLVEFYTIYVSDTNAFSSNFEGDFSDSVVALKGSLDLCVITYQTQLINGVTQTVELGRTTDLAWKTGRKEVCKDNTGRSTFCEVITSSTGGQEYWMDSANKKAFNQYLGLEIFHGYGSAGLDVVVSGYETGLIDTVSIMADKLVNHPVSDGQDALSKMLDNLAIGMTNSLRETTGQKATASGIAGVPEIHIEVQFGWLVIPIASVILSLIFLSAVICQTSQQGVPPWRMSPIAALLSLDHETAHLIASQDHGVSLNSRAKALKVRLGQGENQEWRLNGV
ncbi:MAG: hypothetical protein Q9222_006782 [Ikaeria aurantiellina]